MLSDSYNGLEVTRGGNKHVKECRAKMEPGPGYFFGQFLGNYTARRIYPAPLNNEPDDENGEYGLVLANEFMNDPDYLWELETVAGSKLKATVTLDSYNLRTTPDPFKKVLILGFSLMLTLNLKQLDSLGIENDCIYCRPIARLFI